MYTIIFIWGCNVDTKGPEIRTGKVDPSLGKLKLEKGNTIEVGTDYSRLCTPSYLACSYRSLPSTVKVGSRILVADGSLSLEVTEIRETSVMATILNNSTFGDMKNMNLPGAIVDLPTLTDKDVVDLVDFGVKNQVDFIAASFVRKASDISHIREVLGKDGASIKIIAKIENQEGLENFEAIVHSADGIMVARGDLGMEIPVEKVFLAQKMMISRANEVGRPVITATQMLESMISNPRPTRAEATDVANAVLDGSDAVMLSGETANGEYSRAAVQVMDHTCREAEGILDYPACFERIWSRAVSCQRNVASGSGSASTPLSSNQRISMTESVSSSAVKTAWDVGATALVILSELGRTARFVSKYRPAVPVWMITPSEVAARQVQGLVSNCRVLQVVSNEVWNEEAPEVLIQQALTALKAQKQVQVGDKVVCIHKAALNTSTHRTTATDKETNTAVKSSSVMRIVLVE